MACSTLLPSSTVRSICMSAYAVVLYEDITASTARMLAGKEWCSNLAGLLAKLVAGNVDVLQPLMLLQQ